MKNKNNFLLFLAIGIIVGIVFHKLALGMIFGMATGMILDSRAAKQSAQDKANAGEETASNIDDENQDLNNPK
ncbi:MFS superfamily sulfate permease-like transporter [Mucilaginibacter sp. UYNi724]